MVRRSPRTAYLTFVAFPVSGVNLTLNADVDGLSAVVRLIGAVCIALGLAGLMQSRRVQQPPPHPEGHQHRRNEPLGRR